MDEENERIILMKQFKDYLDDNPSITSKLENKKDYDHIIIDYIDLLKNKLDFADYILTNPDDAILICKDIIRGYNQFDIEIRFSNFDKIKTNIIPIREIRSTHIGKIFSVIGKIRQTSKIKPIIYKIKGNCQLCETEFIKIPKDGVINLNIHCRCDNKMRKMRETKREYVDIQRIVVEEDIDTLEGGQQPERMNVLLSKGLCKPELDMLTTPGLKICITGIIREVPEKLGNANKKFENIEREFMIEANYIIPMEESYESIKLDDSDIAEIKKLSREDGLMTKFINSLAVDIFGYDKIKQAIILSLFGGSTKFSAKDVTKSRGEWHILLIGDPGMGKTKMVRGVKDMSPRYRYSNAQKASGAGFTAAVIKDEFIGTWALEVGSLVLASGGVNIIDELDKMKEEELGHLHEALSEGTISIDKANIHACLKARTTVIACANPKYSKFDPSTSISKQLNMPLSLLNRFDLIFPMIDPQDEALDEKIADSIIDANIKNKEPQIPFNTIRKYIAYAKKNIYPKLDEEARKEVKKIYLEMRKRKRIMDGKQFEDSDNKSISDEEKIVQISARQCEAIIRIAESSAKFRLSDEADTDDVKIAKELLFFSLSQVAIDLKILPNGKEEKIIDGNILETGASLSKQNDRREVLNIIKNLSNQFNNLVYIDDIIHKAKEKNINEERTEEIIQYLLFNTKDIFEPRSGFIGLL